MWGRWEVMYASGMKGSQRITCGSYFFVFTVWITGIKLRPLCLAAIAVTL